MVTAKIMEEGGGGGDNFSTFNKYACACAVVASIVSVIFGYDTGVMSGAMIFIKEELKIGDAKVQVLAGMLNICAFVGALIAGKLSDCIGRRYTIVLSSIIFLLGSVLMGYGPNYAVLLTGRCIAGIGVGFALMVAPVYSAEISSAEHRGLLSSLPEVCIAIGILLGYVSNYFFAKLTLKLGWRMMLGVAAIPSFVLAFGILKMPESPRWLILEGRLAEAKRVLLQVCNTPEEAETRFHDIASAAGIDANCKEDTVKVPKEVTRGDGVWKELLLRPTPTVRWILLAAVGLHFFEHATGIEAVILYGPRIFKKAGVTNKDKLLLVTVGIGLVKLTCVIIATNLLDRIGRRRLILVSSVGIIFALSGLGFCLTMVQHAKSELYWALVCSIVATYTYVAFFNIGVSPVTWVYAAEIFPLKLRAQGVAIGVSVNRIMNALISMTFLSMSKAMTIGGSFFMFAGMSVLALAFFYFFLPETKGKTLEEIELLFTRGRNMNKQNGGLEINQSNSSVSKVTDS